MDKNLIKTFEYPMKEGAFFGEISFFYECPSTASVMTRELVQTMNLNYKHYLGINRENSSFFKVIQDQGLCYKRDKRFIELKKLLGLTVNYFRDLPDKVL